MDLAAGVCRDKEFVFVGCTGRPLLSDFNNLKVGGVFFPCIYLTTGVEDDITLQSFIRYKRGGKGFKKFRGLRLGQHFYYYYFRNVCREIG